MDDKKKLHPQQWLGRPIIDPSHVQDLETRAAVNEFHAMMPRAQAEAAAHDDYVKEHRERAAAHHLAGMKASMATGNHVDARKHWALYDLHLKALGKDAIGAVPPEIERRLAEGDKPLYRFKPHKGDLYALHEPTNTVAPAEGVSIQKAEGTGAKQCKWRLGERRCQRKVSSGYCHSHVDHWANKIKQADHDALEKAGLEKAWPKDDNENTENSTNFASGVPHATVARDALLETMPADTSIKETSNGPLPAPTNGELRRLAFHRYNPESSPAYRDVYGGAVDSPSGRAAHHDNLRRVGAESIEADRAVDQEPEDHKNQRFDDGGQPVGYWESVDRASGPVLPGAHLFPHLKKAWPKDDAENAENSMGFASGTSHSPVARDALLETMPTSGTSLKESSDSAPLPVPTQGVLYRPTSTTYRPHAYRGERATITGQQAFSDNLDRINAEDDEAGVLLDQEPESRPDRYPDDLIGRRAAERDKKKDYWQNIDRVSTKAAQLPGSHLFRKTDMPAGTAGLTPPAPQLHNTVNGFLTAFKALPKEGPHRGKFITQHMNHGPFLSALKAHPQGAQVHSMLTNHLNSKANAGPGKPMQTIVKRVLELMNLLKAGVPPSWENAVKETAQAGPRHASVGKEIGRVDSSGGYLHPEGGDNGKFFERPGQKTLPGGKVTQQGGTTTGAEMKTTGKQRTMYGSVDALEEHVARRLIEDPTFKANYMSRAGLDEPALRARHPHYAAAYDEHARSKRIDAGWRKGIGEVTDLGDGRHVQPTQREVHKPKLRGANTATVIPFKKP